MKSKYSLEHTIINWTADKVSEYLAAQQVALEVRRLLVVTEVWLHALSREIAKRKAAGVQLQFIGCPDEGIYLVHVAHNLLATEVKVNEEDHQHSHDAGEDDNFLQSRHLFVFHQIVGC